MLIYDNEKICLRIKLNIKNKIKVTLILLSYIQKNTIYFIMEMTIMKMQMVYDSLGILIWMKGKIVLLMCLGCLIETRSH